MILNLIKNNVNFRFYNIKKMNTNNAFNIFDILNNSRKKNPLSHSNDSARINNENIDKIYKESSFKISRENSFKKITPKKNYNKPNTDKSLPLILIKQSPSVILTNNSISPIKRQNKRYNRENDFKDYINLVPIKDNNINILSNLKSKINNNNLSHSTSKNNNEFRKKNSNKNIKSIFSKHNKIYTNENIKKNIDKVILSPIELPRNLLKTDDDLDYNKNQKENNITNIIEDAKKKNKKLILGKSVEFEGRKKKRYNTNIIRIHSDDDEEEKIFEKIKFKAFSYSKAGTLENGIMKTNQDSILIINNIFNLKFDIFGIMDGHGLNGHLVSDYVKEQIKEIFTNQKTFISKTTYGNLTEEEIYKQLTKNNNSLIKKIFKKINKNLTYQRFDISNSGTTCNLLIHLNSFLICINIGDSRCIILKLLNSVKSNFEYEKMSFDHKPNIESEKKRIELLEGEIRQDKNKETNEFEGPFRVYFRNEKFPGIAISRSIGDFDAEKIGVICEPDINIKIMENSFKIGILGSDGVWDVMDENDIIQICKKYWKKNLFDNICMEIVDECAKRWDKGFFERDDISVVVVVINYFNRR